LDAPECAARAAPGKGERCGSAGTCVPVDSANGLRLRLSRALQGWQRSGLLPTRRSNATWCCAGGAIGCIALSSTRWVPAKRRMTVFKRIF